MCKKCNNPDRDHDAVLNGRRDFLKAGAVLASAPLLGGLVSSAHAAPTEENIGKGPYPTKAYGTTSATTLLKPMSIVRRALGPHDVLLDVLYCGVCHSDIHQARNEWPNTVPTTYPVVPGHEIIGQVRAVGNQVTKFRVDDIGGVGCMVDSCRTCENCLNDREQNCLNGTTFTYNSPDKVSGDLTYGGYSDKIVVKEHFVVRIPPGVDLPAMAPLLCAGITTFSPMRYWKVKPGQRVGVIGLGGLGHMAVKLAVAHRADVTVFSTTPGKIADAKKMGAKEAVLWNDAEAMKRHMNQFDLMISTVPRAYPMQQFMNLLRLDGTLVNVGALEKLKDLDGMMIGFGRKSLAGSMIGGIAETQEVIDYCAARNIKADVELIRPNQINEAFARVVSKEVRYRFVIDMRA
jgi:uncharacterized zinc-type alcohol dehydrogenase-like protein